MRSSPQPREPRSELWGPRSCTSGYGLVKRQHCHGPTSISKATSFTFVEAASETRDVSASARRRHRAPCAPWTPRQAHWAVSGSACRTQANAAGASSTWRNDEDLVLTNPANSPTDPPKVRAEFKRVTDRAEMGEGGLRTCCDTVPPPSCRTLECRSNASPISWAIRTPGCSQLTTAKEFGRPSTPRSFWKMFFESWSPRRRRRLVRRREVR